MKPKITRITLSEKGAERTKGRREFDLLPGVNILIGPNGSGKSTLINAICRDTLMLERSDTTGYIRAIGFDTEQDNPRTKGYFDDLNQYNMQVELHWISHGQMMAPIITKQFRDALEKQSVDEPEAGLVGCIDEPENGLDYAGQIHFLDAMQNLVKDLDTQLIISSHSPIIWSMSGANIIEFEPGYMARIKSAYRAIV